jgi:hypothetical protein
LRHHRRGGGGVHGAGGSGIFGWRHGGWGD